MGILCLYMLSISWAYGQKPLVNLAQAADSLKLTAPDMKRLKLIDEIVREPAGGAHSDREKTFEIIS